MPRVKPHVKIHVSVAYHPRTLEVWSDLELRGMLVELWRIAVEQFAGKTGGLVTLNRHQIASITTRSQLQPGVNALRTLCERLELSLSVRGESVTVQLRNFAEKQGFAPKNCQRMFPSYSDSDSDSESPSEDLRRSSSGETHTSEARRKKVPKKRTPKLEMTAALMRRLVALTPADVVAEESEIAAWYEEKKKAWADRGYTDYHAAARNWWPRARQWEVDRSKGSEVIVTLQGKKLRKADGWEDREWEDLKRDVEREKREATGTPTRAGPTGPPPGSA